MNKTEFKSLALGDIVYWKAAGMYSSDQRRGPLCVVVGKTSGGALWLIDTTTRQRFSAPYQRMQLYYATEGHRAGLHARVDFEEG